MVLIELVRLFDSSTKSIIVSTMYCIILKEMRGREITATGPILLRLGRTTKMAVFWSYFRDFVGAQKIEDLSESKTSFAEVFRIKSRFVLAKKNLGG